MQGLWIVLNATKHSKSTWWDVSLDELVLLVIYLVENKNYGSESKEIRTQQKKICISNIAGGVINKWTCNSLFVRTASCSHRASKFTIICTGFGGHSTHKSTYKFLTNFRNKFFCAGWFVRVLEDIQWLKIIRPPPTKIVNKDWSF